MLRVGLTGDLGSGKSTVAGMLSARGAIVLSSDAMGRALMQPGQPVFTQIVARFGAGILAADGTLDRRRLAAIAFDPQHPRVDELNAIVHPAVIGEQMNRLAAMEREHSNTIAVIESALLFTTTHAPGGSWQTRFDRILLVTAPEEQKIARFVDRAAAGNPVLAAEREELEADARRRLSLQRGNAAHAGQCLVLHNDGDRAHLEAQVEAAWLTLQGALHEAVAGLRPSVHRTGGA